MYRQFRNTSKYSFFQKAFILFCIAVFVLVLILPMIWFFEGIEARWGSSIGVGNYTLMYIAIFTFATICIAISLSIDYAIRHRKLLFRSPQPGSWAELIMAIWIYTNPCSSFQLSEKAKRRGRKSAFTLDEWNEVTLKWEQRDQTRNDFTLGDVIKEKLGMTINKEPIVSESTYYKIWRIRSIRDINHRQLTKSPLSEDLPDKPVNKD